jgi:MFS family permease
MSHKEIENLFAKKITFQAIIILLIVSTFYLYEFVIQISPGVMQQELMRDFAIDATQLGLLSGFFYLSYTPLQLFGGLLLDRYSARVVLTSICFIFSLGVLLFAYAPNIYVAVIARFIMGGAASCAFLGVLHLSARWVPPIHFALFAGIAEMMGALGGFGGTKYVALVLEHFDWRTTIKGFACIGVVLAILIALVVRDQPSKQKVMHAHSDTRTVWSDLKNILHNRETWSIGLYSFCIWAPILGLSFWGVEFMRLKHNFDAAAAAQIIAFAWVGTLCACPVIGWLSDVIQKRCVIMLVCAVVGAVAMTIVVFVAHIPTGVLYLLMFAIGFASSGQTLSFALIKDNNSPYTNSAANGFNNMVIVAGGLLFQPLVGGILDMYWQGTIQNGVHVYSLHSYQMALLILPICYFIAVLVGAFFIKETRCIAVWQEQNME